MLDSLFQDLKQKACQLGAEQRARFRGKPGHSRINPVHYP
jgi:hypothetical protein